MIYDFNLAYPYIFICLAIILICLGLYRWFFWQPVRIQLSLCTYLIRQKIVFKRHVSQYWFFILRFLILFLLVLAISRPQSIDPKSQSKVEGIDIILVLDVSQSMLLLDDLNDPITRIEIAKKEAINFIASRKNDPIGLVLFARYAYSRCPLTLDKTILQQIVERIEIGDIDPGGTFLAIGMMTAINRLKKSTAKSRIMILLTDGQPTPGDLDSQVVTDIAKKLDIKIYTIGIGSKSGGFFNHPVFGPIRQSETFDPNLLKQIAQATGGQAFEATNASDMRQIYQQIDRLEKSNIDAKIFTKKIEYFDLVLKIIIILLILELCLAYFIWFAII